MAKCKITVVKRLGNQDLVDQFGQGAIDLPCPAFNDAQEFVLDEPNIPAGFCSWAWADINRDLVTIMFGGDVPWIRQKGTAIACCTDGLRPVVFKIERTE